MRWFDIPWDEDERQTATGADLIAGRSGDLVCELDSRDSGPENRRHGGLIFMGGVYLS